MIWTNNPRYEENQTKKLPSFQGGQTLLAKRWNNNSNNSENSNNKSQKTTKITIDGITNWNVIHLKYLIKTMENKDDIPTNDCKLSFDVSFLLSLIECALYLSGGKTIITKNFLLNYLYQCHDKSLAQKCKNGLINFNLKSSFTISKLENVFIEFDNIKENYYKRQLIKVFLSITSRRKKLEQCRRTGRLFDTM